NSCRASGRYRKVIGNIFLEVLGALAHPALLSLFLPRMLSDGGGLPGLTLARRLGPGCLGSEAPTQRFLPVGPPENRRFRLLILWCSSDTPLMKFRLHLQYNKGYPKRYTRY